MNVQNCAIRQDVAGSASRWSEPCQAEGSGWVSFSGGGAQCRSDAAAELAQQRDNVRIDLLGHGQVLLHGLALQRAEHHGRSMAQLLYEQRSKQPLELG